MRWEEFGSSMWQLKAEEPIELMLLDRQNKRRGLCTSRFMLLPWLSTTRWTRSSPRTAAQQSPRGKLDASKAGFSADGRRNSTGNTSDIFFRSESYSHRLASGTWACQMTSATAGKRPTKKNYEARVRVAARALSIFVCSPTGRY